MASSVGQRPGWPEGSETCPVGCSSQVRVPGEADRVSPRRADGKRQTEDGRGSWTESYPQWHMNRHMTRTGLYARDATGYAFSSLRLFRGRTQAAISGSTGWETPESETPTTL
ncbi:hypothetical protein E4U34_001039 [Claviceps purpurea]|nr:hypothetical protein E4U28_003349 [Claviceps purpurea]KAG6213934.1 hypothetical protein E4U50_000790 [Claviceps purpurea]KAG6223169.1 hypothetical protein E4U34_001039 [Claviceps purpurea]